MGSVHAERDEPKITGLRCAGLIKIGFDLSPDYVMIPKFSWSGRGKPLISEAV